MTKDGKTFKNLSLLEMFINILLKTLRKMKASGKSGMILKGLNLKNFLKAMEN